MPAPSSSVQHESQIDKMSASDGEDLPEQTLEDALFEAVMKNDLDTASVLASVHSVNINYTNNMHKTLIYLAIENDHVAMVRMLLYSGIDVNLRSYCSAYCSFETPIVTAARLQNHEIVDILLEHGCELDVVSGKEGKTALQWAATHGDILLAKLLFSHGADVNWLGPYFHTALHYATIAEKPDMVKWLLESGAEISDNGDGRTSMHIAAARGNFPIVKHLLRYRAKTIVKDNFSFTPFSLACLRGQINMIRHMMENSDCEAEFDIDDGLHKAAECGHLNVLQFLLNKGADVNSTNIYGESALSIAARGQPRFVQLLLVHNAKINTVDKRGYTPLQHAVLREQVNIAITLIRHGAYLHTYNHAIESPLQISCAISNPMLVKCLLDGGCNLNHESWFKPQLVREKMQELDFQYSSLRFQKEKDLQRELWLWVIAKVGQPQTLSEASRISIRQQLIKTAGGSSVLSRIHQLPLPGCLQKYISLEN